MNRSRFAKLARRVGVSRRAYSLGYWFEEAVWPKSIGIRKCSGGWITYIRGDRKPYETFCQVGSETQALQWLAGVLLANPATLRSSENYNKSIDIWHRTGSWYDVNDPDIRELLGLCRSKCWKCGYAVSEMRLHKCPECGSPL